MSEMVTRVAKAIYENEYMATIESGSPVMDVVRDTWDQLPERRERYYLSQASAAIAAMREPTEEMRKAGGDIIWEAERRGKDLEYATELIFRGMIDAALK